MKIKVLLILIVTFLIVFSSCKKEPEKIETLSVTPSSKEVSKDAESFTINIKSNVSWTVKSNKDWCIIESTSGNNNSNVNINIIANTTTNIRNAVVTIEGNEVDIVTVSITQEAGNSISTTVTDFDGNVYQTVKIGSQIWMAENLKVTHYPNGDLIPNVIDDNAWKELNDNNTDDAYCYYDNSITNGNIYGALYTYAAAIGDDWTRDRFENQGVCPDGWHLPTDVEWVKLINYLGGANVAGGKMKEVGITHWSSPNNGADNSSGFSAIAGGYHNISSLPFIDLGNFGNWWCNSVNSSENANFCYMSNASTGAYFRSLNKSFGFSVRCVQD